MPRRRVWAAIAVLAGGALGVFGWALIQEEPGGPPSELELVASGVRYNGSNPELHVPLGRPVRLTVRNAEPGGKPIFHDFAIAGMGLAPTRPLAPGDSVVLEFTPRRPGVYTYHCPLHPGLMNGKIVVE